MKRHVVPKSFNKVESCSVRVYIFFFMIRIGPRENLLVEKTLRFFKFLLMHNIVDVYLKVAKTNEITV